MNNTANLGLSFTTTGAEAAEQHLDAVATKAASAERATDKLAAGNVRASGSIAKMNQSVDRVIGQLSTFEREQIQAASATDHLRNEQEALIKTQQRLNAVHGSAVGSSKALTQATLNMTRQFADVGVSLASGASPFMVLIQQGPQIADGFQMAASQGLNFKAVIAGLYAQAAPLLAILAPIAIAAGAVGSVFALSARQINEENKGLVNSLGLTADQLEKVKTKTITMGDVAVGTFNAAKGALAAAFAPELKAAGKALDTFLDNLALNTVKEVKTVVGAFMGAYGAITSTWKMLPAAFGDAVVSAANATLEGLAKLVNGAIGLLNPVIGAVNSRFGLAIPTLDTVKFAKLRNDYAGQMAATGKAGAEAFAQGLTSGGALVDRALGAITSEAVKAASARMKSEAGKAKATKEAKDHAKAIELETSVVVAANEVWPERAAAMQAAEKQAKALREAQQALNVVLDKNIRPATSLENLITALDQARERSDAVRNSVDDIFWSIRGNDWAGAFSGLLRTIDQVKKAFDSAATSKDRMAAIAGVAQGVGNAIGGTTGSAIAGTASSAMAGFTVAGPIGAVVGGLIGGISSLFGSSKAKKQAKAEAEAQRLAEEQARLLRVANEARQLEIEKIRLTQGELAAELARRDDVLKAMDASNQAAQKEIWALQDAADAKAKADALAAAAAQKAADIAASRRELEIQLLEAMGKTDEAAKMRLADERAAVDESLRGLFDQIQAENALTAARDASARAAQSAAELLAAQQSDAANLLATARQNLKVAYDRDAAEIRATRDQMAGYAQSFREFRLGLSGVAASGANFYAIAAKARLGDTDAMGQLVGAAQAANSSAMSGASTQIEFLREQARIRAAVQAAEDTATRQVSIADQQLAALTAQVSALGILNESTLTVAQGIAGVISAINTLNSTFGGAVSNPNRNWGANPDANMALARQGYAGDFGGGGFQAWAVQQDETTKAKLREILMQQGQAYRIAFATGGSLTVGGNGGTDTTPVNFMATRGEVVNVSREDVMASLLEVNRALLAKIEQMQRDGAKTAANTGKTAGILNEVTRGGDSTLIEAVA